MKRLQSRHLIIIVAYSVLLLTVLHLLDCNNRVSRERYLLRVFPKEVTDPRSTQGCDANSSSPGTVVNKKQHVYLHATWRTGSSFTGELFNQHPRVFYLYEPMWLMWQALYPGDAESLQGAVRDMLRSLFQCDFSVLKLYSSPGPSGSLTTHSIYGWRNSKVICSAPLCSAYKKERVELVNASICEKQCAPRDIKELETECRKYDVIVIKDVRVLDAGILLPLMQDPSLNFKVVQLVRDPRAVHNSRMKSKFSLVKDSIQVLRSKKRWEKDQRAIPSRSQRTDTYVSNALEVICEVWSRDQVLVRSSPAWITQRYLTIRYEDLVLEPVDGLRTLYTFANLTVLPSTETYVLNMTRGIGYSSVKPFRISSRDARETISAWKKRLSLVQIKQVEQKCQKAMKLLGYQLMNEHYT